MSENQAKIVDITARKRAIVVPNVGIYTFDSGAPAMSAYNNNPFSFSNYQWECFPQTVGGYKIIPFGANNNLPEFMREVMEGNHLAPGIINRKIGLLTGDGAQLYKIDFENGEFRKEFTYDKEIWDWLNSWNFRRYIDMARVEYQYMNGIFSRQFRNKGARIRQGKILELEIIPNANARLEWTDSGRLQDVKGIITADFTHYIGKNVMRFPVFDLKNPMAGKITMSYHNTYSFGHNFYSLPSYYGALKWIMMSSDVPEILKYMNENGITAAYHIHSPQGYWDEKMEQLSASFPQEDKDKILKRLDKVQDEIYETMKQVLAGKKNAGKFITTVDFIDPFGDGKTVQSWKVEPIEQKMSEFSDMQNKIAEQANSASTSGMSLHPGLSNIIVNGKLASGSEMLYAFKLYLATDTTIAEEVIFENINQCIAINFPDKDLKMGFYHRQVQTEEATATEDRIKNQ